MLNDDIDAGSDAWLDRYPADASLELGGERVYLKAGDGGAELGATLYAHADAQRIELALRRGFASALRFEAGLALAAEGAELVLSRWLPGVRDWRAAAPALEQLLDQLDDWRAALAPPAAPPAPGLDSSHERRMRLALGARGAYG